MPLQKGHKGYRNNSTSPRILSLELRQLVRLAKVAQNVNRSIADRYQALGMMHDRLEAIDRRFCQSYYDQIPEGLPDKSYEDLIGTHPHIKTASATAGNY